MYYAHNHNYATLTFCPLLYVYIYRMIQNFVGRKFWRITKDSPKFLVQNFLVRNMRELAWMKYF